MKKTTLLSVLLTSILALGAIPFATAQDAGKKEDMEKVPVIMLVPPAFALNDSVADGCWARLYDDANFRGQMLTLSGPIAVPSARVGPAFLWGLKYDSLIVGPKATLTVYDNEYFKEQTGSFKSGQRVPDLDRKLGLFENIRSFVLQCS